MAENTCIPFLPGYSFGDPTKHNFRNRQTLSWKKGVAIVDNAIPSTAEKAVELLNSENKLLDNSLAELTYGPKKPAFQEFVLPKAIEFDKKVLRFTGYFREDIKDWPCEKFRIRPIKVLYYLKDDTMEVIEPKTQNSGLPQGLLIKRHCFPHPCGKGIYLWKDLNLGKDLRIYGKSIRLTDCDAWTREYLTSCGIELNETEVIPTDNYTQKREAMKKIPNHVTANLDEEKFYKFLTCDRKVLKFYGMWDDTLNDPPDRRKVILQYFLVDDTLEVLEVHSPNNGRDPCSTLIKRQKVPLDRRKIPETFPLSYLELGEEDLKDWFKPKDLQVGKEILCLGRKIYIYDCDKFTRSYYKTHFGIESVPRFDIIEKPKAKLPKVVPPHTGIGTWEDSLQSCFSLRPEPPKKDFLKALHFRETSLRFAAQIDTPCPMDQSRQFVITFYLSDDTVSIFELPTPNSGIMSGTFLKRTKLQKGSGYPGDKPIYYKPKDFYIGAEIEASGRKFIIKEADKFVYKFMEENPELYPDENINKPRKKSVAEKLSTEPLQSKKEEIMNKIRQHKIKLYGPAPCVLPQAEALNLGNDLMSREIISQKIFSANLPIPSEVLNKAIDICEDDDGKIDADELKKIILPPLEP